MLPSELLFSIMIHYAVVLQNEIDDRQVIMTDLQNEKTKVQNQALRKVVEDGTCAS